MEVRHQPLVEFCYLGCGRLLLHPMFVRDLLAIFICIARLLPYGELVSSRRYRNEYCSKGWIVWLPELCDTEHFFQTFNILMDATSGCVCYDVVLDLWRASLCRQSHCMILTQYRRSVTFFIIPVSKVLALLSTNCTRSYHSRLSSPNQRHNKSCKPCPPVCRLYLCRAYVP